MTSRSSTRFGIFSDNKRLKFVTFILLFTAIISVIVVGEHFFVKHVVGHSREHWYRAVFETKYKENYYGTHKSWSREFNPYRTLL